MSTSLEQARELDAADPLAGFRDRFVPTGETVVAYLDGNSLGRPPKATGQRLAELVESGWGSRLIRSWSEGWLEYPERIGDLLGEAVLGAAPGQVVVADSTSVCLYKALRAALALRPGRTEIITDRHNFPTDNYVVQGIAAELGLTVRWIDSNPDGGVTAEELEAALGARSAVVSLSHVSYQSACIADLERLSALAHAHDALVVWDLCHSAGAVPVRLDEWGADFAVGCTYKFLNAGPGAPAFLYVHRDHLGQLHQPIWGWMGSASPFAMQHEYQPAPGIRQALSGTPPIVALVGVEEGARLVAEAGIGAIRRKSGALTQMVDGLAEQWLVPLGFRIASPRDPARRGAHVSLARAGSDELAKRLIDAGVVIDFRPPDCIRVGLSPLTTSFEETWQAMNLIRVEARSR